MSATGLAELIAAGFFAAGMAAAVYVLLRLAGLISTASQALADYHGRATALIEEANSAVSRAQEQLARTDSITASMDEVTANMAELSGHVSALAGLARGICAGFGTPLLRLSALVYGVRRALALRSTSRRGSALPQRPAARERAPAPALSQRTRAQSALPEQAVPQAPVTQPPVTQPAVTQPAVTQRPVPQAEVAQPAVAQRARSRGRR